MSDIHAARDEHELQRRLQATSTWKPMDTAPKDGTHVLLRVKGKVIEGWWDKGKGIADDYGMPPGGWDVVWLNTHGCGCCGYDDEDPNGWLPLPGAA